MILPKLPVGASGIATHFLSSNLFELCDRLRWLLQEKRAGFNSSRKNAEAFAILDKLSK